MDTFIPTGSTLVDLILGGGFAMRRIGHIVGDPSTNKTGLAIELCANFFRTFKTGQIFYCDAEAAFDVDYASELGMPALEGGRLRFCTPRDPKVGITVEDFSCLLDQVCDVLPEGIPGLFILDSLDALPTFDEATNNAWARAGGYKTEKAKLMGEVFRVATQKMAYKDVALVVISQTRDNVAITYGSKKTFTGGKAIQFYVSQRLMLQKIDDLEKMVDGQKKAYGTRIKVRCDKNKCASPMGEAEIDIVWHHGIDDLASNLRFLSQRKKLGLLPPELVEKESETSQTGQKKGKKKKEESQSDSLSTEFPEFTATTKEIAEKFAVAAVADRLRGNKDTEGAYSLPLAKIRKLPRSDQKAYEQKIKDITIDYWKKVEEELASRIPGKKYEEEE